MLGLLFFDKGKGQIKKKPYSYAVAKRAGRTIFSNKIKSQVTREAHTVALRGLLIA